ncbi:hypothetical protein [Jatrophihabitans endophyticus]|uniref:hypothetical protein n=1 Tax=Jatrophihabitans endophyticus TaxID=1206085 RepID=UPI000A01C2B9|nr:hypothetical protein [Jatrophihabitans endophyticus]
MAHDHSSDAPDGTSAAERSDHGGLDGVVAAARAAGEDAAAALALAVSVGGRLPLPGSGATERRWQVLTAVGRASLTAARVLEAHSDALAVLAEAGLAAEPGRSWGVFAAEAPGLRLDARAADADTVRLSGTKPWCSLAGSLDRALVTAFVEDGRRRLFAVDLRSPGVRAQPVTGWVSRGLRSVPSTGVEFDGATATPVGEPEWYLDRPGFAWGGCGVAACWYGGALGVADTVRVAAADRGGELPAMHVGAIDAALTAARCVLADAAAAIDAGRAAGAAGATLALRVRAVVADAAERVLRAAAHALGPAPLAFDADHAARVADLEIYVRQHHAERDLAALGRAVLGGAVLAGAAG